MREMGGGTKERKRKTQLALFVEMSQGMSICETYFPCPSCMFCVKHTFL